MVRNEEKDKAKAKKKKGFILGTFNVILLKDGIEFWNWSYMHFIATKDDKIAATHTVHLQTW